MGFLRFFDKFNQFLAGFFGKIVKENSNVHNHFVGDKGNKFTICWLLVSIIYL